LLEDSILRSREGKQAARRPDRFDSWITEGANKVRTLVDATSKQQAQGIEQVSNLTLSFRWFDFGARWFQLKPLWNLR